MLRIFFGANVELSFPDLCFAKGYRSLHLIIYIASSGFLESVFLQQIEKKRIKTLVNWGKMRTFAGRLLSD